MSKNINCQMISSLLAEYLNGCLHREEADSVEKHLLTCPSCQGIAHALDLVLRSKPFPRHDLWPLLRSRLAALEEDNPVQLVFPSFTWPMAAALTVIILILVTVPNPLRLLAAIGIL